MQEMSKKLKTHKDLDVWKESMKLAKEIYILTRLFPEEEMCGMVSQMRRCAVSIPSNIAEGAARNSKKEFLQFLCISPVSVYELETRYILAKEFGYTKSIVSIEDYIESIRQILSGLISYFLIFHNFLI
jgi:four helix bundle protein